MYNQENRQGFFPKMFPDTISFITFWMVPLLVLAMWAVGSNWQAQYRLKALRQRELLERIDKLEKQLNTKNQ